MDWYTVIKVVNGIAYLYRQRTRREGGRVVTESEFIGRAPPARVVLSPSPHRAVAALFPVLADTALVRHVSQMLDARAAEFQWTPPTRSASQQNRLSTTAPSFVLHSELHAVPAAFGLSISRLALPRTRATQADRFDCLAFDAQKRCLSLFAPERYIARTDATGSQLYHHDLVYGLAQAIRQLHIRISLGHAADAQLTELAAAIVLHRLGLAASPPLRSAAFFQLWRRRDPSVPVATLLDAANATAAVILSHVTGRSVKQDIARPSSRHAPLGRFSVFDLTYGWIILQLAHDRTPPAQIAFMMRATLPAIRRYLSLFADPTINASLRASGEAIERDRMLLRDR